MNPMADMFDFNKNLEQFTKFQPDFAQFTNMGPLKAFNDMAAKYRAVAIEALNKNVELTTAWMQDAAKDATTLLTTEAQPTAYAKKIGEVAQASMQDIPARLFAYAEVAKKAQTELFDTAVALTPKAVEEAAERTKTATKAAAKKAA
jgi:accessory colonization factor AcfC